MSDFDDEVPRPPADMKFPVEVGLSQYSPKGLLGLMRFPISIIDLSSVMVGEATAEHGCQFPLWSAEMSQLREQLHALGHELTWLSIAGIYAVTPSNIWARKENK